MQEYKNINYNNLDIELLGIIKQYLKSEIHIEDFRKIIKGKEVEVVSLMNEIIDYSNKKKSKNRRFFINIDSFDIKLNSTKEEFLSTLNPLVISCKEQDGNLKVVGPRLAKKMKLTTKDLLESDRFYEIKGDFYDFPNGMDLNMRDWYKIIDKMPRDILKEKLTNYYKTDNKYVNVVVVDIDCLLNEIIKQIKEEKEYNFEYSYIYSVPKKTMDSILFINDNYINIEDIKNNNIEIIKSEVINDVKKKKLTFS